VTAVLTETRTVTAGAGAGEAPPRRAHLTIDEVVEAASGHLAEPEKYRRERARALGDLLAWLDGFPGRDWQQRWINSHADALGTQWGPADLVGYARRRRNRAVIALVALEVIRPSMSWLRNVTPPHLFVTCRAVMDPATFESLQRLVVEEGVSRTTGMLAMNTLTLLRIRTGRPLLEMSTVDFVRVVTEWRATGRALRAVDLSWHVLRRSGGLSDGPQTYRAAIRTGQCTVTELVDRYGVRHPQVRALLVDYLSERAAAVDYTTLVGLARMLVKHFWVDLERHHPGIDNLRLAPDVAEAWKQRLRHLPDGRPRSDYFVHLMMVRGFFLDLAQWALTEPGRWARWVAPPPITAAETAGQRRRDHRTKARMQQRTRTLAPLLPALAESANTQRLQAASLLTAATEVAEGDTFTWAGATYLRMPRTSYYSDGDARPSIQQIGGNGEVLRLHRQEESAFWAWALIEVFRLTGVRVEELLELTHLSIRRYLAPTGEMTPILQIAPSKSDRERVLPADPELVSVLAAIVRRVKGTSETLPLVTRYDPLERTWGPALPHLFQARFGGPPRVLHYGRVRKLLGEVAARANLRDVDGTPLRFTPHDMRRIFATEVVNGGLPIHIAQQLLGHLDMNTTKGYVAVYPDSVIEHYRRFIDRRRTTRPGEEYRDPTAEEWADFEQHFTLRRVALGTCHRPYGTACVHEHACVRCPMLRMDPAQLPRLSELETNTVQRLEEARSMSWLGEVSALEESLRHIADKKRQAEQVAERTAAGDDNHAL
jgi:integrase